VRCARRIHSAHDAPRITSAKGAGATLLTSTTGRIRLVVAGAVHLVASSIGLRPLLELNEGDSPLAVYQQAIYTALQKISLAFSDGKTALPELG
jgi:hypothetical protein